MSPLWDQGVHPRLHEPPPPSQTPRGDRRPPLGCSSRRPLPPCVVERQLSCCSPLPLQVASARLDEFEDLRETSAVSDASVSAVQVFKALMTNFRRYFCVLQDLFCIIPYKYRYSDVGEETSL